MSYTSPEFWIALMQIIGVNIVLSGDNAVVIALAARGLPAHQQKRAVAWGSGAAVVMRIGLTIVAVELLRFEMPAVKGIIDYGCEESLGGYDVLPPVLAKVMTVERRKQLSYGLLTAW